LIDPAFYEEMSVLLNTIIKERKEKAISYKEYLKKIAELAKKVQQGKGESTPEVLNTPAKRVLYNNLGEDTDIAVKVHETVLEYRLDGWRGNDAKEMIIKYRLFEVLHDAEEVERIFPIIKEQGEY